jgi:hypothetical protein
MPTTFVGLCIFVAFLTPGFLYATQRRVLAPQAERSALMETTLVVSISLVTNALAGVAFGLVRWRFPSHTPDIGMILRPDSSYCIDHLPYVMAWIWLVVALSCALAVAGARWESARRFLNRLLAPVIIDSSAWCETFATDPGQYVHAGLELTDGSFVSGRVVWFSTDLEETGDRDVVLGPPLTIRTEEGAVGLVAQRVVLAARDIHRIDVTYISDAEVPAAPEP